MKILSAEQIRQWDQYTIDHEPVSSLYLMERAAQQCTDWIISNFQSSIAIKIFCGKGNNGGDGLAIARQLADNNIFAHVYILEIGAPGTEDFQENFLKLREYQLPILFIQEATSFPTILQSDIIIDALFGSGVNRPLAGLSAELAGHINKSKATVISIDVPSGMYVDQSSILNPVIKAGFTLTFEATKLCFMMAENEDYFGNLHILPIQLSPTFLKDVVTKHQVIQLTDVKQLFKPRKQHSHKGTFGHALIVAGEEGKMGAAILASKACIRSGAGLVTTLLHKEHFPIMQVAVPEAMCLDRSQPVDYTKYASIGTGPGLGTSENATLLLKEVLLTTSKPLVIDADGLNILSLHPEMIAQVPAHSILTPHPKEFERLFGYQANDFERLGTAQAKAKELNIIIILKGKHTAIVSAEEVYFNNTGNAGMATAGSGDVLTGILTGLLACGYATKDAAILGVYVHGLAGDLAVTELSQEALIAGDLIAYLGKAFLKAFYK